MCRSHFDCHLMSSDTIGVEVSNKLDGWNVHAASNLKVIIISGYTLVCDYVFVELVLYNNHCLHIVCCVSLSISELTKRYQRNCDVCIL